MLALESNRSRKGFLIKKAVFAVVVFIVGMTAWGIVQGMLTSNFLGPTQQSGDINQMAKLAENLEQKCDEISSTDAGPGSVAWQMDLTLNKVEEVRIFELDSGRNYVLDVVSQESERKTFQLEGCDYRMEGEIDGAGSYSVDIEEGSGSSPTVVAVVS